MSPPTQWGIFTVFSVSFIMNVSTHLMRDLIPHQVGGDALIRWSPSCGGWGPNSLQVLTKTPFIIVYQAYDYIDMIISCKALQWQGLQIFSNLAIGQRAASFWPMSSGTPLERPGLRPNTMMTSTTKGKQLNLTSCGLRWYNLLFSCPLTAQ